jgi:hypothetical protein
MADEQATAQEAQSQGDEQTQNGSNGRKTVLRAAALAAASGATAFAAKKAFSGRHDSQSGEGRNRGQSGDESLFSSMLTSGWDSARDSLLPFAEEAATGAGEFVARNAPEMVRDNLVPKFISGFEGAKKKSSDEE